MHKHQHAHKTLSQKQVVNGAVGPFDTYCDGYGNPGASGLGYISVLKLSTGTNKFPTERQLDMLLELASKCPVEI